MTPALAAVVLAAMLSAVGCRADEGPPGSAPVQLSIACGALGVELRLCTAAVRAWEAETGHRVTIVSTPNNSSDRLALYLQLLGSRSAEVDVLLIDVVWTGILASRLADLGPFLGDLPADTFPSLVANNTIDGRLVAVPWWVDVGVLYYRSDLLAKYGFSPPETWQAMTDAARVIQQAERQQGHTGLWGFVFQGNAYEGLTCNALEWIASFGGGSIVNAAGEVTVDNPRARAALTLARSWVGDIAPRGVLSYTEEAARGLFQTGNAVFMRNWPYAWALAQTADSPVRGRVGVVKLPAGPGGESAGTLGGWHLAVSRQSRHPAEAASLVAFLTSRAQQRQRAIEASYNPTLRSLYSDPGVLAANPFFGELRVPLETAVARPARIAGPHYNRLSNDVWRAVHGILGGESTPDAGLMSLTNDLNRLKHRADW
ncbi:MAG: ABC transporter substrate-binding protein [Vicinamibacterales bacterium]